MLTKNGKSKLIPYVLYIPGLNQNLLSVGQHIRKGYIVKFDSDYCIIIEKINNQLVIKVQMSPNKDFLLIMLAKEEHGLQVKKIIESLLWHWRYGHLNKRSLKVLKEKNMVIGLPFIRNEEKVHEGCIYSKFHRLPFTKTSWRAKALLELVHVNICGPARTPSINQKNIFSTFCR